MPTIVRNRIGIKIACQNSASVDLCDSDAPCEQKSPRPAPGAFAHTEDSAYRLTWTLVPPPGAPLPGSPLETNLTQSESLSLKYEVSLAVRSASRLFCCVPEAAVVN